MDKVKLESYNDDDNDDDINNNNNKLTNRQAQQQVSLLVCLQMKISITQQAQLSGSLRTEKQPLRNVAFRRHFKCEMDKVKLESYNDDDDDDDDNNNNNNNKLTNR